MAAHLGPKGYVARARRVEEDFVLGNSSFCREPVEHATGRGGKEVRCLRRPNRRKKIAESMVTTFRGKRERSKGCRSHNVRGGEVGLRHGRGEDWGGF